MFEIDWHGFAHTRENSLYRAMVILNCDSYFVNYNRLTGRWPNMMQVGDGLKVRLIEAGWRP